MRSQLWTFLWMLRRAALVLYQENCLATAKGAAYSALLSFFPVITTIAALLVQFRARAVSQVLSRFLSEVVPPGSEELVLTRFAVEGARPASVLVVATLVSLYAASGVMLSLIDGFNAIYHVPVGRPLLRQRAVAALLVFSAALPAVGASALILFGGRIESAVVNWMIGLEPGQRLSGGISLLSNFIRLGVALGAAALAASLLFYTGPHRRMQWRMVWPGAVLATVLWLGATLGFGWYAVHLASFNVMYGSIATVIALIVWMYLLAVIALYGCAFNAVREQTGLR